MSRVLFVDDDRKVLDGLRRNLFSYKREFTMVFEDDPAAALQHIAESTFDAVVTDFRMPGTDGAALLRAVRTHQPGCARLILSGHVHEEDMVCAATVAHQFLSKPCDVNTLVEALRRATRVAEMLPSADVRAQVGALQLLPSPSSVISDLHAALDSHTSDTRQIAALASRTPSLAAKMLQLVNSSFFGFGHRVDDVTHAAALLGTNVIRSLVLMSALVRTVEDAGSMSWLEHADHVAYERACAARRLAPAYGVDPELAFSGALLQEVGQIVMRTAAPRPPADDDGALPWIIDAEAAADGAEHAGVGAFLLSMWALPLTMVEAVGGHTTAPSSPLEECMRHAQALVEDVMGAMCTISPAVPVPAAGSALADVVQQWRAEPTPG